jgi:glutaminase
MSVFTGSTGHRNRAIAYMRLNTGMDRATKTGEKRRRVASLGPGPTFGEMALFDGCARSADVVADEKVICYGLAVEQLKELAVTHPNFMLTILSNLTRDFSERLRHANEAIRSLE